MEMNINYPSLVEQGYAELKRQGIKATKEQVYRRMVEFGMIDETGQPTQEAIDNGLIDEFEPDSQGDLEPVTLAAFKRYYPEYAKFEDSHFTHTSDGWAVDAYIVRALANERLRQPNITAEERQKAYELLHYADDMEQK